jgi:thiol:disulfide interchange protein
MLALGVGLALLLAAAPARSYYSSTWYEGADGYARAVRQQRASPVPMLVYFRTDWCPHCRALDDLLAEPEVRARLAGVIKVRIDPERGEAEQALFESQYPSSGFPALFLRAEDGTAARLDHRGPSKRFLSQLR